MFTAFLLDLLMMGAMIIFNDSFHNRRFSIYTQSEWMCVCIYIFVPLFLYSNDKLFTQFKY